MVRTIDYNETGKIFFHYYHLQDKTKLKKFEK